MFRRLEISLARVIFWVSAISGYWMIIFLTWMDTRFKVFMWSRVIFEWADKKNLSDILASSSEMEGSVWLKISQSGTLPGGFASIPVVIAILLFLAPFTVRNDYRRPVRGYVMIPLTVAMCYISVSLLNAVTAAGIGLGLHLYHKSIPGPDFFIFMVQPLYLVYPLFKSVPGLLSQCLYIAFIYSVISTPGKRVARQEAGGRQPGVEARRNAGVFLPTYNEEDESEDRMACVMETDRFCRILHANFGQPALIHRIKNEILDHISTPSRVSRDVGIGIPHYRIVLTEARNSARKSLEESGNSYGERDIIIFITGEMERMEYITGEDSKTMNEWIEGKTAARLPSRDQADPHQVEDRRNEIE
ncbi:MAG: hypothetical protein LBI74_09475 [Synergistaceae bacterium]|jgi:hypothetical protein|nr:hypothetical protein [Synergistaceae bacterium]